MIKSLFNAQVINSKASLAMINCDSSATQPIIEANTNENKIRKVESGSDWSIWSGYAITNDEIQATVSSTDKELSTVNYESTFVNNFEDIRKIAKGGFGVVFMATKKSDGLQYAVKRVELTENLDNLTETKSRSKDSS